MIASKLRNAAVTLAAAAALALSGCEEKCPTEPPQGDVQNCEAGAGQAVTVQVQPCEKCNQSGTTCNVDIQGEFIQLDLTAEACDSGADCPIQCNVVTPVTCTFTAPATAGEYSVQLYNPSNNQLETVALLTVTSGGAASCALN